MKNTRAKKNLGESGERVAALLLEQRGYKIIARNFRTRTGEMDIIAQDADGLAFVEVRARRNSYGSPEESVTMPRKRARLFAVAEEFLSAHPQYENFAWRIDLVAIELDRAGRVVRTDVVKNAVEG
ncbi:MAG: YraN family protein [Chloroflexi bacterium]|nr:YraN family protein [Chloroflexota bacterium]